MAVPLHSHEDDLGGGKLDKEAFRPNAIRFELYVPLGYIPTGLDAATTGIKFETKQVLISAQLLSEAKEAYFESDLQQLSTGAVVALELYDYSAPGLITSLSLSATTKRARSADIKASLVAGNAVGVRLNVTTAVTGGLGGGASPVLIIVCGVS